MRPSKWFASRGIIAPIPSFTAFVYAVPLAVASSTPSMYVVQFPLSYVPAMCVHVADERLPPELIPVEFEVPL
jgi:hypothetical protein